MTPDPIRSSSISNSCGEIISSNCVVWAGPYIEGVCKGSSITDVIYGLSSQPNDCCQGTFGPGNDTCYTGNWVDFTSTIPIAGTTTGGFNWGISTFGGGFPTGTGAENNPQYKWTRDGDLKVRGSFALTIDPYGAITNTFLKIPLVTVSPKCFPLQGNLTQTAIVATDAFIVGNQINIVTRGFLTIEPSTGILYFNFSFAPVIATTFTVQIFMGSTTFNLN
jgi:hypothetical protein